MAKTRRAVAVPKLRDGFVGSFYRSGERTFEGYVVDVADPTKQLTVDILIDGTVSRTVIAREYQRDLAVQSKADGYHGFSSSFSEEILKNASVIEARLSNLDRAIGSPISIGASYQTGWSTAKSDSAQWLGGLRFSGSTGDSGDTAPLLVINVDGERVIEIRALGWAHKDEASEGSAVRAFDFHLPERFADGCVHRVSIHSENGEMLGGTPLSFIAFADGLAKKISELGQIDGERLRGELFDLLLPMSIPMLHYDKWRERFPLESPAPTPLKAAIVLIGRDGVRKTLPSLEEQSHLDWMATPVEGKGPSFDRTEVASFFEGEAEDCAFVVFGWSGVEFEPDAIARIASAFNENDKAQIVYGDIDVVARDGRIWPLAFPAFDYERMLEQGYCAHLFAMRRQLAGQCVAKGATDLYRLFNSAMEGERPDQDFVLHLPGALGRISPIDTAAASAVLKNASIQHLRERQIKAEVDLGAGSILPAVRIKRQPEAGRTTVIIPTRNRQPLLERCLQSILPAIASADADVLIVDNGSTEPEALQYLAEIASKQVRVLRVPGPFNFARLNNMAVQSIRSEYLCLLNNDVEAVDDSWLDEMLGRLSEPDVGAVGALLLWPSGVVQHGGVVLGASFAAHHAFNDRMDTDPGYADLLRVAHECSAVTAACMLTRRSDYLSVSGMDEIFFAIAFNDVDYCLKLRALGKRVVFTPHAKLWHLESASRGKDDQPDRKLRFQRELRALRAKWSQSLIDDPYYNPALSLDAVPYSALAWPPRPRTPRALTRPVPNELPSGF